MTTPNPCQIEACQGQPICAECQRLGYCPTSRPAPSASPADELRNCAPALSAHELTEAILQMREALPKASRMQTTGSIVILTLGPQIPTRSDANTAIGFIRAMVATGEKRAGAKETSEIRYSSDQRQ